MIVMDCCAAIEIVERTNRGQAMISLLEDDLVVAPTFLRIELRNAYWKYVQAKIYTIEEAQERIALAEDLVDRYFAESDYLTEAFSQSCAYNHPVYDLIYLCIARRNNAILFTTDQKLRKVCIKAKVNCLDEDVL